MPLYEYQCDKCRIVSESMQSIDERQKPCEVPCTCGGKLSIKVNSPAIVAGVSVKNKNSQGFLDRIRDMKKVVGKDNTLGNIV